MVSDPFIGVDVKLIDGDLANNSIGDLDLVGDIDPIDNMRQAISLRLETPLGKYYFAQGYGTSAADYIDEPTTDGNKKSLQAEAKATILEDPRIALVNAVTVSETGTNQLTLYYSATTKSGRPFTGTAQIGG